MKARDLFAGAGGWDVAADGLGWAVDGIEIMPEARATRAAAGLKTTGEDVRDVEPRPGEYDVDIASPPCQTFSAAGKGAGRQKLDAVLSAVASYRNGIALTSTQLAQAIGDERTALVVEPLRVALLSRSTFLAWEQVPSVLPIWEACAEVLREAGYSVATDVISAEQYAVPQIRRRAILVARRDGATAALPVPTHSLFYARNPFQLDPDTTPWATMSDALGWGMSARPYPTIACSRTTGGPDKEKVGGSAARASIYAELDAGRWIAKDDKRECRLSLEETALLQTFPDGFPFAGTLTQRFRQIGNAIPPVMASAILRTFLP